MNLINSKDKKYLKKQHLEKLKNFSIENIIVDKFNLEKSDFRSDQEWKLIGVNFNLEPVYQNINGKRKLIRNGKAIYEKQLDFDFCRVTNQDQYFLVSKNFFNRDFFSIYKNSLVNVFSVWFVHIFKNKTKEEKQQLFNVFRDKTQAQMRLKFLEIWKEDQKYDGNLIPWNYWLSLPNFTNEKFGIGVQYGLGKFLNERNENIFEFGLKNEIDSCLFKHPVSKHIIYSENTTPLSFAPYAKLMRRSTLNTLENIIKTNNIKFNVLNTITNSSDEKEISFTNSPENELEERNNFSLIKDKQSLSIFWLTRKDEDFVINQKERYIQLILNLIKNNVNSKAICIFSKKDDVSNFLNKENIQEFKEKNIVFKVETILKDENTIQDYENNKNQLINENDKVNYIVYFNLNKITSLNNKRTLEDFATAGKNFWKNTYVSDDYVLEGERKFYEPVSELSPPTAMVSNKIAEEIKNALNDVEKEFGNIDNWIAKLLKISTEELKERLTSEQIDAVSLGISSLLKNKGLIIADETGFGKGRILAAIVVIGLLLGKKICFFTENKQLFSDFYRDLTAVKPEEKLIPLILNQTGRIYSPDGELIVKNHTEKKFKEIIANKKEWEKGETKFIVTNYAQINRKGKNQPKVKFLYELLKGDSWIILDEAHNASGQSNIYANLKYLLDNTEGVIFSSATYAKTEEKLDLYKKAIPLNEVAKKIIKMSLFGDNGILREMLTKEIAKNGSFIRREHPPIELPEYVFVENTLQIEENIRKFSDMWQSIFDFVEERDKLLGNSSGKVWLTLGGVYSRSVREFMFLSKIDGLVKFVKEKVSQNEKVVIVTEMTFEAILRDLVENNTISLDLDDKESQEEDKTEIKNKFRKFEVIPNWSWKWQALIDNLISLENIEKEVKKNRFEPDNNFDEKYFNENYPKFLEKAEEVRKVISKLDSFMLSPLDELKEKLKQEKISFGELSGRTYQLYYSKKDNEWVINNKLEKKERVELVADFNSGKIDVVLLTGAGSTGISLHASETFKDQRKRNLIEWDVASNSANRIQFWGRVRRRGQVSEPSFYTILLNIMSDIRKIEVEKRKQIKLSAHTGGRKENLILDWVSLEGEMIAEEWAKEKRYWAKRVGAYTQNQKEETKRIDKLLNRSIVLPVSEQKSLFARIEKGIQCHNDFHFYISKPLPISSSFFEKNYWGMDKGKKETNTDYSILNLPYITLNYRSWLKELSGTKEELLDFQTKIYKKIKEKEKLDLNLKIVSDWKNILETEVQKGLDIEFGYKWQQFKQLGTIFSKFRIGDVFEFSFNNELYTKLGVLVNINWDNWLEKELEDFNSCSALSLNTAYVEVLFEGDLETVKIPLSILLNNKGFKLINEKFNLTIFNNYVSYFKTLTIEGNPILFSNWQKKTKIGKVETILDENKGSLTSLIIPNDYHKTDLDNLDLPFVSIDQIKDFLYEHNKENNLWLYNAVTKEKANLGFRIADYKINNFQKGKEVQIFFKNKAAYLKAYNAWLFKIRNSIKSIDKEKNLVILKIEKLYAILSLMEQEDLFLFCPNTKKEWFARNAFKYFK